MDREHDIRPVCPLLLLPWLWLPIVILATEPSGHTWLVKEDGKWKYPHEYTCDLIIVDNDKGTRHRLRLTDLFPGEQYRRHVDQTTAGPLWGRRSFYYVLRHNDTDYFCMHCWTGKRLLVNLTRGKVEDPQALVKVLDSEERRKTIELLRESSKLVTRPDKGLEWERVYGAMLLVAQRGMVQAQGALEVMEKHSWQGPSGLHAPKWGYGKGLGQSIRGQWYAILEGRRFAQLALRRLGLKPKGYSQYVFEKERKKTAIPPDTRKKRSNRIKIGMTSQKVYDVLGAPDYTMTAVEDDDTKHYADLKWKWIAAWRYDFDVPGDFSLILMWDDQGRLCRIEKVSPALWRGDALFSDKMSRPVFRADGDINGIHLYSPHFLGRITVVEQKEKRPEEATGGDKK